MNQKMKCDEPNIELKDNVNNIKIKKTNNYNLVFI